MEANLLPQLYLDASILTKYEQAAHPQTLDEIITVLGIAFIAPLRGSLISDSQMRRD